MEARNAEIAALKAQMARMGRAMARAGDVGGVRDSAEQMWGSQDLPHDALGNASQDDLLNCTLSCTLCAVSCHSFFPIVTDEFSVFHSNGFNGK